MGSVGFEWDANKAAINFKIHGVHFAEALAVFQDDYAITITDDESDPDEERFVILGMGALDRLLVVVHCYRDQDRIIRIISTRKAEPHERQQYEDNR